MDATRLDSSWILSLESQGATLARAGGKGASLARLYRAGFPVPDGFIVTTEAYDAFVAANELGRVIDDTLAASAASLEAASSSIRAAFAHGSIPPTIDRALRDGYGALRRPAVAVRSSATAEDLPERSFAGQQESYLNVIGERQLLDAVVACWASLWTERAIGYRARTRAVAQGLSLAVVVQCMVESEASGVMFTANPVTGLRSEVVIEATIGLGEALVSGRVEPDRFTVDLRSSRLVERTLGAKRVAIRGRAGGGTEQVDGDRAEQPAIDDRRVIELAALGAKVAAFYGEPQDIEWTLQDGALALVQSRPITSLYPIPDGMQPEPLQVMLSFGAVQGLLDPLTPFGADMIRELFAVGARIFGFRATRETQRVLESAGARLWSNITPLLRNSIGRRVARGALAYVEPTVKQALASVWDDPRLRPQRAGIRIATARRLARFFVPLVGNVIRNMIAPARRRAWLVARAERILESARVASWGEAADPRERLALFVDDVEAFFERNIPRALIRLISGVASGMVSLHLLNMVAQRVGHVARPGIEERVLEITRGVRHNPTTEMDLALWSVAARIRSAESDLALFERLSPAELAQRYADGALPAGAQESIDRFLDRYGARGLAELDSGRPRWREQPVHLFELLAGYLRVTDSARAPEAVFARSAAQAEAAIERLAADARAASKGPPGRLLAAHVRFAARRARALLGFREFPKFFAVRMLGLVRERLLGVGEELTRAGLLGASDDLFFVTLSEQRAFGRGALDNDALRGLVARRCEEHARELLRRQIPRLLLSDGRAFFEGMEVGAASGAKGCDMLGSPVSPGSVEARVRVVLDPRTSGLEPGEILVCPGTDPSWTPLFLIASGLVMEVGGMMTHGAVVAREYGIPAVVGVHEATMRLRTGQRIRVDGSSGKIALLD